MLSPCSRFSTCYLSAQNEAAVALLQKHVKLLLSLSTDIVTEAAQRVTAHKTSPDTCRHIAGEHSASQRTKRHLAPAGTSPVNATRHCAPGVTRHLLQTLADAAVFQ